jgi:hypothetical protein
MNRILLLLFLALTTMQATLPMDSKPALNRQAQEALDEELRQYALMLWVEKVEDCLKGGANPNSPDLSMGLWINSYPLLITMIEKHSSSEAQEKVVDKLLAYGAYVNSRYFWDSPCFGKKFGPPVLLIAAEKNLTKICEMLLNKGADANAESSGMTALMWSKKNKNVELTTLLRRHGANERIPKKKPSCFDQCSLQ